ncbi:ribosomal-processing cysteine protease Prp [Lactobacillus sp. DCY120]|uniref:Ribosomal processing cysteine protease Prp n=1 Tax=Bombilactobacillus apium TaxID=2675299 RepID=A0A850R3K8_9LACO|nr:ribosomal-processing cysteine protease Prp [Bombilactobacillus apium]NVY96950.1 ribosomal-processing cysteine protease Prp [Bombilactobacillus apium]
MITAVFQRNQQDQITDFLITGHADSGPYGQDIVCAAVSITSLGTINCLQAIAQTSPQVIQNETEGGYLQCHLDYQVLTNHDHLIAAQTLMLACYQNLFALTTDYADFIQVQLKNS